MITIDANFDQVLRGLADTEKRHVPFAMSLALNATGHDVKTNTEKSLSKRLDRPTRFTQRGLAIRRSSKRNLVVSVFFKDIQSEYLRLQETGGRRTPAKRAIVVPVNQRLNRYGNMPRHALKRILARSDTFEGTINGVPGIWQRPRRKNGKLKLLIAYEDHADYQPRLRFEQSALKTTRARMPINFKRAMKQAISNVR